MAPLPIDVIARDLNRDGWLDLAFATIGGVTILLGSPSDFASPVTYPTGHSPRGLAAVDLDGDGNLDLVVANGGSDNVALLLGDGAGAFSPRLLFTVGSQPRAVVSADFNRDGLPDLLSANRASDDLSVLLQTRLGISPSTLPVSAVGTPFPTTTLVASGGTPPLTLTLTGSLPQGLVFDPLTGRLFGTPTQAGSFSFSVTVQDAIGCVRVQSYGLIIGATIPTLSGWAMGLLAIALAVVAVFSLRRLP